MLSGTDVISGNVIKTGLPLKTIAVRPFTVPTEGRFADVDCEAFRPFPDLSVHVETDAPFKGFVPFPLTSAASNQS